MDREDESTTHQHHAGVHEETPGKGQQYGEQVKEAEHHAKHHPGAHTHAMVDFRQRFIVSTILTIPILALSPIFQSALGFTLVFPGSNLLLFLLATVVYFYGGYPFLNGILDEVRVRLPGMMTLIAVAITVAYVYSSAAVFGFVGGEGFFWELATLIDIMLLGHWIEMRSVLGASRALEELVRVMPSEAHRLRNGSTEDVAVERLRVGDRVLIRPGEKVPVDGVVVDGVSTVNEAMLTGESAPVTRGPGDTVTGGSINGEGSLVAEMKKAGKETYLAQVVELVRTAQESRSRAQDLANRAAFYLVVIALSVGFITLVAWLLLGQGPGFAIERAATVMVITCPHALGLAVPLVVAVSTALAAQSGLLIRERQAFERARDVQAVVFDKTGTLTEGRFGVTDLLPFRTLSDPLEVLRLTASLEANSEHPIARGIVRSAEEKGLQLIPVSGFRAIPGRGIEGTVDDAFLKVVSPGYLKEAGAEPADERVERLKQQGKTVVFLLKDDLPLGAIALADIIRGESREAIARLKGMGIRPMMLTGDNRHVARWVAEDLGLDAYFAEVLPHEKAEKIREVQAQYRVAMVGDGVNDAPALVQADVGIAIGAGTDVAVESADIVLVRNDPRDVADIILLSRKTYRKMMQNLLWATGYNTFAIPLAAGVAYGIGLVLTPAIGAILMSASTVIVAINARTLSLH
ncbi:copper-translocating P-type ATPase [Methanoculleus sp.]|uniref:copper-translocating P-type ATPase n=1 Tax=Methanoculleus sp. TaxID=90427 RepID=UPI0025F891A4|nr:copper-translocating P-type ATPase [Methanoculleus sp.]